MERCSLVARSQGLFYYLLACVVHNELPEPDKFTGITPEEWKSVYDIARSQGVAAVVFECIKTLPKDVKPHKQLLLTWIASAMSIESKQHNRRTLSCEFANELAAAGIYTLVLKGLALSRYYPNTLTREFGDFDCILFRKDEDSRIVWDGCCEEGNLLAEKLGGSVKRHHYKHSHIALHGLIIENHQFALPVRGNNVFKDAERHLRNLLSQGPIAKIADTNLLCPPASFNALFLIIHSLNHFLYESIKFRHILDWALFLRAESENIDWEDLMQWCKRLNATRFVYCFNYISKKYLGLDLDVPQSDDTELTETLSELILKDMYKGYSLYNKGYSPFRNRVMLIRHFFASTWKYREICQTSAFSSLLNMVAGFIFDRNPKI